MTPTSLLRLGSEFHEVLQVGRCVSVNRRPEAMFNVVRDDVCDQGWAVCAFRFVFYRRPVHVPIGPSFRFIVNRPTVNRVVRVFRFPFCVLDYQVWLFRNFHGVKEQVRDQVVVFVKANTR